MNSDNNLLLPSTKDNNNDEQPPLHVVHPQPVQVHPPSHVPHPLPRQVYLPSSHVNPPPSPQNARNNNNNYLDDTVDELNTSSDLNNTTEIFLDLHTDDLTEFKGSSTPLLDDDTNQNFLRVSQRNPGTNFRHKAMCNPERLVCLLHANKHLL